MDGNRVNVTLTVNGQAFGSWSARRTDTAAVLAAMAAAHRRGEHPYGSMRRDCPLCR
jgi:hypothetical protein